ncbi:MAG: glutamate--tRNA ligase [Phycisphaerae bacterium]|nr:glutamate--tRNA ligase [Phycisphaerae bacterium]
MIVTRFAPSPTGYLHVGGARTALFNWLLARQAGGKFLLRIEDTDTKRNTATAADQVLRDLQWLGIDWDEGPDIGGPNGPYKQSERRDIYDTYIAQLIDEGKAYYCFDTPEELAEMRVAAEKEKRNNIYPRPAVFPDAAAVEKARAKGRPVTVRLAITQTEPIVIEDEVRGTISIDPAELSDFIIQKSDGFPTYHMAVVIDDELMGVTHVIRGQEHLMNTPNHQLLQKALGFRIPTYAHMSVTVSEGGGKLSKRERPKTLKKAIKAMQDVDIDALANAGGITSDELDSFLNGKTSPDMPAVDAMAALLGVHLPEINIVDFFRSGYLPETLVNFFALLGWNPGDGREIMDREELIQAFDLSRVTKSNSLFDRQKLMSFNTEHLKTTMTPLDTLVRHFRAYLEVNDSPVAKADDTLLERIIRINEGARTLEQIEQKTRFAFLPDEAIEYDEKAVKKVLLKGDGLAMLAAVGEALATLTKLTPEGIETLLRGLAEEKQVGLGKVAQPLRVAICGNTISPPIFDAVDMLGMETTLKRIQITLEKFRQDN